MGHFLSTPTTFQRQKQRAEKTICLPEKRQIGWCQEVHFVHSANGDSAMPPQLDPPITVATSFLFFLVELVSSHNATDSLYNLVLAEKP